MGIETVGRGFSIDSRKYNSGKLPVRPGACLTFYVKMEWANMVLGRLVG